MPIGRPRMAPGIPRENALVGCEFRPGSAQRTRRVTAGRHRGSNPPVEVTSSSQEASAFLAYAPAPG
jgi:hypothetical protein